MSVRSINQHLARMRAAGKVMDIKRKGAEGEAAVMDVVHNYRARTGGLLKQGFTYPYASNRQSKTYLGNIFWDAESHSYKDVTKQLNDEIDVLYISPYRIFPIEVKAYHEMNMELTDQWMLRKGKPVDKSPLAQAEKHARHLYHQLYDVIPDGDPAYIVPIVCFVDRCNVTDNRSEKMQQYIKVVSLDSLVKTLRMCNTCHKDALLDLSMIEKKLHAIERSSE